MNQTTRQDQPQAAPPDQGTHAGHPAQLSKAPEATYAADAVNAADAVKAADAPNAADAADAAGAVNAAQGADAVNPAEATKVRVSTRTNQTLLSHWWLLTLRGVIAILFGALTLLMPGVTLLTLTALFAAFALVGGAVWTFGALRHRQGDERWWLMLLLGVVSLAAGAIAMLHPAMTTVVLIMLVGANALVTGVTDIIAAVRMRKIIRNEWLLGLSGVASVLFGAIVLLFPTGTGALALAAFIGIYALLTGTILVALSLRLRAWPATSQKGEEGSRAPKGFDSKI